jgi:hypothetical protein
MLWQDEISVNRYVSQGIIYTIRSGMPGWKRKPYREG